MQEIAPALGASLYQQLECRQIVEKIVEFHPLLSSAAPSPPNAASAAEGVGRDTTIPSLEQRLSFIETTMFSASRAVAQQASETAEHSQAQIEVMRSHIVEARSRFPAGCPGSSLGYQGPQVSPQDHAAAAAVPRGGMNGTRVAMSPRDSAGASAVPCFGVNAARS